MVFETYKTRARRLRGEFGDVYQYDEIPLKFRAQLIHIVNEYIGPSHRGTSITPSGRLYIEIVDILRKDLGVFDLAGPSARHDWEGRALLELKDFVIHTKDTEAFLSCVELLCVALDRSVRRFEGSEPVDRALNEINAYMQMEAFGYRYSDGIIIRIDSQILHSEVVQPALEILRLPFYKGTQAEYLTAHEAYRNGDKSQAIIECNKAFESIMKAICDKRGWAYNQNSTASKLVDICLANNLIPSYWQTHFTGLRTILESSIPTVRNKTAGHGSGTTPTVIPDELVPYVMHMTAATLLFLAEAENRLP